MNKNIINIVSVLVYVDGEILILKRGSNSGRNAGKWELAGGKLDFGESFEDTASRELAEETSIDTSFSVEQIISTHSLVDGNFQYLTILYELTLESKPKIHLSDEHEEYRWLTLGEVDKLTFSTIEYKDYFKAYFHNHSHQNNERSNARNNNTKQAVIYSDGGSRGNPGPSATGYVIYDEHENELARGGTYIGIATNNQAEYLAVKEGLVKAKEIGVKSVDYYMDSMLVVKQMSGEYKIKNKDLWPIHQSIKDLSSEFNNVSFTHVRREKNKVADSIVNEVLDDHQN